MTRLPILITVISTLAATAAYADRIDGTWCSPDNRRSVAIDGEKGITPAGNRVTGHYTRHGFTYVIPEGEAGAGGMIAMRQLSEEQAEVSEPDNQFDTWHRCDLNS